MERLLESRQMVCVLAFAVLTMVLAFGDTVITVKEGDLEVGNDLHVGNDLYLGDDLDVDDDLDVGGYLDVGYDVDVGEDLEVWDTIGGWSRPWGCFCGLAVDNQINTYCLAVYYNAGVVGDLTVLGKTNCDGGLDPAYLLLDEQTRQQTIERVQKEVPPGKQGGAVLFFDKDSHRLETYVPDEGKFYDLGGNVVHALSAVAAPTMQYRAAHYLDWKTGQVASYPEPVQNRYRTRSGYRVDEATGQFINERTGAAVAREEAIEFYNASDGIYYDLQGRPLRKETLEQETEYVTEYYFDRRTGQVGQVRRPVRELYAVKEGFRFDQKTGQFLSKDTGEAVPRETAIELRQTPSAERTR